MTYLRSGTKYLYPDELVVYQAIRILTRPGRTGRSECSSRWRWPAGARTGRWPSPYASAS